MAPSLHVVMYHYVLDPETAKFPRLKGMSLSDFRTQVAELSSAFEMATLESSLAYLDGTYSPRRELCLLTFDDGVTDHFNNVLPVLAERKVQGIFSVITGCMDEHRVADVHMNHFLMASLDFADYRNAFLAEVQQSDETLVKQVDANAAAARRTYVWDSEEVASFKYFYNFILPPDVRSPVIRRLFERHIGPEAVVAKETYLDWEQARTMQSAGMVIGGHSHCHRPLSTLAEEELQAELTLCRSLLDRHLRPQALWPFCYPYGKLDSFNDFTVETLQSLGFCCGLSTEAGPAQAGSDLFRIRRIDCKLATPRSLTTASI